MKLIILDRDGVINHDSDEFIKSPDEWLPIKGSLEAITQLSQAGYHVAVITNQSGIGRGLFSTDTLSKIHQRMIEQLRQLGGEIKSISFCPHHPDDNCDCRKPKPGLFNELAARLNRPLTGVFAVGDSLRDLQAANTAGATPVLVKTGKGKTTIKQLQQNQAPELGEVETHNNLASFVDTMLSDQNNKG